MTVYDSEFGTDWTTLDRQEVLQRAFALGVAASCGRRHPEEYERLVAAVDGAYDRSMVELAYSEGKQKAARLRRTADDTAEVWHELVVGESTTTLADVVDRTRPPSRFDLPPALARTKLLARRQTDGRDALRLPGFLRRD